MEITTVGLDLAKNVFQVHAIGSTGGVVVRRSLRACLRRAPFMAIAG
jgi:transposase